MQCCWYLSRSKNASPCAQNRLPVDENQDPVGWVHCRVKGEFYNDSTRIYTTLYSKGRTARSARHCTCAVLSVSFSIRSSVYMHSQSYIYKPPLQSNRKFSWASIRLQTDYLVACKRCQCKPFYNLASLKKLVTNINMKERERVFIKWTHLDRSGLTQCSALGWPHLKCQHPPPPTIFLIYIKEHILFNNKN